MNRDYSVQLEEMFGAISPGIAKNEPLNIVFGNVDDDFWYWLFTHGYDNYSTLRQILPGMPDERIQANFTGKTGHHTLSEAFAAYRLFKKILAENFKDIKECSNVLDFGCVWGRIIRFFLKDVDVSGLWGIDCYKEMIDLCKTLNLRCNFLVIDPIATTSFPPATFDMIYLYSVFSHLSEEAHLAWLEEFKRILKPSGVVIATTRTRNFIYNCYELSKKPEWEGWERGSARSFNDLHRALADYDEGKFVHSPTGGGGILDASFFGQSCIPKKYVLANWTNFFSRVGYMYEAEHQCFKQDVIYAQK